MCALRGGDDVAPRETGVAIVELGDRDAVVLQRADSRVHLILQILGITVVVTHDGHRLQATGFCGREGTLGRLNGIRLIVVGGANRLQDQWHGRL
jgi:hypothetical protein